MNEYLVGDIVWAKLTGYPWWPAKIVDEKTLNKRVLAAKPKNSSTIWPVLFFGSFDYGWFGNENLCYFDEGLAEHGSLNRRGNLFARAVKQAQDPQDSEESEESNESDDKPTKQPTKRSTRPGSQNVPKNLKRSASPVGKEKKAKIEKEPVDPASSDLSNSSFSSPVRRTPAKRSRPVLTRNSKDAISNKISKPVSEEASEKAPEDSSSEPIVKHNPSPPKSPLSKSPKSRQQPVKEKEDEDVSEDIIEMRSMRAALQKAAISGNYKDAELIDKVLTTLENGVFSSKCLLAAKMAKLMRHLHTGTIPKNNYRFNERIRILGIRFKAAIESKSSDSFSDLKDSESLTQSVDEKSKSGSKKARPASSIEPTSDRDSETDSSNKNEIDEAIFNLISEPTEKNTSTKNDSKNLRSGKSKTKTSAAPKQIIENADSSDFLDSVNNSKDLDISKADIVENDSPIKEKVQKTISSQASSPRGTSQPEFTDGVTAVSDKILDVEPRQASPEKESTSIPAQNNRTNQKPQNANLDEASLGESKVNQISNLESVNSKSDAIETNLELVPGLETKVDKDQTNLNITTSYQDIENISSNQNLEGGIELSEEQIGSPSSVHNKDSGSSSNHDQALPDEPKVEIHDVEKEASTVSPPSVTSPVVERASIAADSPSSSRATITSL